MKKTLVPLIAIVAPLFTACQSTADFIAARQPKAVATAEARGRTDLNCPAVKAAVVGQQDVTPVVGLNAPNRAVFTIAVAGCDKRATYVVVCPDDGTGDCSIADTKR